MVKFEIHGKDLKDIIEKVQTVVNKKANLSVIKKLYFKVDGYNVKCFANDFEQYLKINADSKQYSAKGLSDGIFGIDIEDIKPLTKMNEWLEIEEDLDDSRGNKVNVKCGKKIISIPIYIPDDSDDIIYLPTLDESEKKILSVKENWLLQTVTDLKSFTKEYDTLNHHNAIMEAFNFNTFDGRLEALDGHRIGVRSLENQTIYETTTNRFETVRLHNKCVNVFRKLLDKKSENEIEISQTDKFVKVKGKDFTYIQRRIEGQYFDVSKLMDDIYPDYRFTVDRENMLNVIKYNVELGKDDIYKPTIFYSENENLYSLLITNKYTSFDEIETSENTMKDFCIGLNNSYMKDVFEIIDKDEVECELVNAKTPIYIHGNEYNFVILPVNIGDMKDVFRKYIDKVV